ncbi:MAG: tetratricopeptide repeat protein [Patescibacteria group bacterium]
MERAPDDRSEISPHAGRAALWVLVSLFAVLILFGASVVLSRSDRISGLFEDFFGTSSEELLPITRDVSALQGWSPPLTALLARAEEAVAAGELTLAEELYDRALAHVSKEEQGRKEQADLPILRKLYDTVLLRGNEERAEELLGILSFHGVPEEPLNALRGFLRLRLADIEGARELFSVSPENPEQSYGLLLIAILEGQHEEFPQLLAVIKTSSDPLLQHAATVLQGAQDEFALFQDGQPEHRATLLARALAEVQQCALAERLLMTVLEKDPEYRDAWLVLGYCRLMLENGSGAKEAFEKAYTLDPEKAETQYFLGVSHERSGDTASAKTYFGYALQNGFEPASTIHEKLAQLAIAEASYAEAADHYRAILAQKEEDHQAAYRALATLLIEELQDPMEAEKIAHAAREEYGDTPLVLDLLGWSALALGKRDEAATYLTVAVQQDSSSPDAWYHRAALAQEVGDRDAALQAYRKAYEFAYLSDPDLALKAAEKHNALMLKGQ